MADSAMDGSSVSVAFSFLEALTEAQSEIELGHMELETELQSELDEKVHLTVGCTLRLDGHSLPNMCRIEKYRRCTERFACCNSMHTGCFPTSVDCRR